MLKFSKLGKWPLYWGNMPLPEGAEALGTVQRSALSDGVWWEGALIRLSTGIYVQGNAGGIRSLPQDEVKAALALSEAAAGMGRTGGKVSSDAKAAAVRENGKLGGRGHKKVK